MSDYDLRQLRQLERARRLLADPEVRVAWRAFLEVADAVAALAEQAGEVELRSRPDLFDPGEDELPEDGRDRLRLLCREADVLRMTLGDRATRLQALVGDTEARNLRRWRPEDLPGLPAASTPPEELAVPQVFEPREVQVVQVVERAAGSASPEPIEAEASKLRVKYDESYKARVLELAGQGYGQRRIGELMDPPCRQAVVSRIERAAGFNRLERGILVKGNGPGAQTVIEEAIENAERVVAEQERESAGLDDVAPRDGRAAPEKVTAPKAKKPAPKAKKRTPPRKCAGCDRVRPIRVRGLCGGCSAREESPPKVKKLPPARPEPVVEVELPVSYAAPEGLERELEAIRGVAGALSGLGPRSVVRVLEYVLRDSGVGTEVADLLLSED